MSRKLSDLTNYYFDWAETINPKSQLSLGVKNILHSKVPADLNYDGAGSTLINESLYDINGRRFFVTYSQKF